MKTLFIPFVLHLPLSAICRTAVNNNSSIQGAGVGAGVGGHWCGCTRCLGVSLQKLNNITHKKLKNQKTKNDVDKQDRETK